MLSKLSRILLFFMVVSSLLSLGAFQPNLGARAEARAGGQTTQPAAPLAGPIYTQPVNPSGTIVISAWLDPNGSNDDRYVWDNFTLPADGMITEIQWVGGYDPAKFGFGGPVLDFQVSIYPSIAAGTEPAVAFPPLVQYMTGGNAGETPIGMVSTIPMNSYTFSLPAQFTASAGVKYWIQVEAFQGGSIPDWGFAAATGGDASHHVRDSGAGGDIRYHTVPGDVSFSLVGLVASLPTYLPLILR